MNIVAEVIRKLRIAMREKRRWTAGGASASGARVFYGQEAIPGRDAILSGGMVKTQDLQACFPNCVRDPNILYLVSSRMPPYAPMMARIAKSRGGRVVVNQNGVAYKGWCAEGWEKVNESLALLIQNADHVFYQSEFCKLAADRFLGACRGSWEILRNPVDTNVFVPRRDSAPRNPCVLLLAGTHTHAYRVTTALSALRCLRDRGVAVRLLVAGRYAWESDEEQALANARLTAQSLGVTHWVEFEGAYAQDDALSLLHRGDVLLHTQYNDSCPRLVVEAMASGLPVVYSGSGGTPELVGSSAGIGVAAPLDWEVAHPPSPEELADAVQVVMNAYGAFSHAARARAVEQFDVKPWLERHAAVFDSLLAS